MNPTALWTSSQAQHRLHNRCNAQTLASAGVMSTFGPASANAEVNVGCFQPSGEHVGERTISGMELATGRVFRGHCSTFWPVRVGHPAAGILVFPSYETGFSLSQTEFYGFDDYRVDSLLKDSSGRFLD